MRNRVWRGSVVALAAALGAVDVPRTFRARLPESGSGSPLSNNAHELAFFGQQIT